MPPRIARTAARPPAPEGRKARALATRRRMLEAAYRLFCARGYPATTMADIAEAAGVAVQTLYFTFHTKGAILSEVLGAAVVGFERWPGPVPAPATGDSMLEAHPWFAAFIAAPDAAAALTVFVDSVLEPLARTAPLVAAMHAASGDPEVHAIVELGEQRRADGWSAVVKLLAKKPGGLRRGLGTTRATDILLVVLGNATLHALFARGWSPPECRRWFLDVLGHQLLE